ncbi:MAG TPA: ATP-dependent protease [Gammaproteobacteria bacterium]|nr:ATP-dependent protease [Gammaproteobacteria bacterium]
MSLAVAYSRAQAGVQAPLITVEVHLANGLPSLSIVGMPETAVRESKDRVRSALQHSGFEFPARRITINLAPADLPKQGGRYDLAIALGVLVASGQLPEDCLQHYEFVAELALGGALRPVRGLLPAALAIAQQQRQLICATENGAEAALADPAAVLDAGHLLEVCEHLRGLHTLTHPEPVAETRSESARDLCDVRGQRQARRALEICAAGGHNLLLVGPPGTGKTLLASRLPGLLPDLDPQAALETAALASIGPGGIDPGRWRCRPFRTPHHTASAAALVGGGSSPRPGEISLAHNGVLFLDELPEFKRHVLEVLREPLETGTVTVSRATAQVEFPARFQLIAAMNPCSCGYLGDPDGRCQCSREQVQRYRGKISGPLMDRIDMHVEVPRLPGKELDAPCGESSAVVRRRVIAARDRQLQRCGTLNSRLDPQQRDAACALAPGDRDLLLQAMEKLNLSARAYHRILKVARTIADLAGCTGIETAHLGEAINYRQLDRRPTP